ncbi:glycosyltransferase [Novosphingobium sp. RD2P27]|uniref:Glycosyltransferase n=1 Tax=Novosphingobium kalidii TaxID=3230299 RepID=A0ABV2D017_9SPHN
MRVLVIGGTVAHHGGVVAFCQRSREALAATPSDIELDLVAADSAFLPVWRLPAFLLRALRLVRRHGGKAGGVWVQYVNLPDLAYVLLARLMGHRVMVTPHLGSNWRSQSHPMLRQISKLILGRASRLALISSTQELEIALPPGVPRSYIRTFLPTPLWAELDPGSKGEAIQLIHSGRLSAGKGTFLFVDLCAALRDRGTPFFARITGGANRATMAELEARIAQHGLKDHIQILGHVPEAEQLRLLRASDVLVHLSRIDSYPLIVLEALACGVFPVCMELAGARDMIETYAGKLVSEEAPVEEATAFLSNIEPARLRSQAIEAAQKVREDYDWSNCVALLRQAMTATF